MPLFKVIRASAGSGKTFNLTREYLRLLFTGQDVFLHILAVTFTNKATEEMKSRIIRELYALSSGNESKQLEGLTVATGLTEKQIRNKSGTILKRLLHNYSGFSVCTIDSFFQRIIRSFTRELGIQEGYTIELDTELILSDTIGQLLIKAGEDKALLSWLVSFAESLIEKGESWNFRKSIQNLGREIFKEEFRNIDAESLKLFSDRRFLNDYRAEIYSLSRQIENTYTGFGQKAMKILDTHGLKVDDFSNKSRGPAGFLLALANGYFKEPTQTAISAAASIDKWVTSASPRRSEIINIVSGELIPLMQKAIDYYQNNHVSYYSSSVILKNLYALGILIDLSLLADKWCSENNAFLLPEAPVFLNRIIDGNDTPFIYEKAGYWYHHYMIDEFQDTSIMQWMNFKPLISNSLSQNYDNLAVGDTKQSIYRWRNSNWEILENQINRDFLPGVIHSVTLRENWRSQSNIISFNNTFFNAAASLLQEVVNGMRAEISSNNAVDNLQPLTDLYGNMEQVPGNAGNTGGYVHVEYINPGQEQSFNEIVNNKLLNLIYELLDRGYHLSDIAILMRKNSEAKMLADFLLSQSNTIGNSKHRLDVISDEALRLGSSIIVNSVVAFMKFIISPTDRTNNYYLQSVYYNYLNSSDSQQGWIKPDDSRSAQDDHMRAIMPGDFLNLADSAESFSLTEVVERIIMIFRLEHHTGERVYISAFRDLVIEFSHKNGSHITKFLDYWNETGKEKSISAPSGQDALRILTLHKSKGLEFRITIIPYCTWELITYNKSWLWCKPGVKPFEKMKVLPLAFTTQLEHTIFAEDYYSESYRQYVDNLNLLYVAFTRAKEALFVFCKSSENDRLKTVSDLTAKVLGSENYTSGNLQDRISSQVEKSREIFEQELVTSDDMSGRVKISFQGKMLIDPTVNKPYRPLNEGKILHEIFNLIRTHEDIIAAVTRLQLEGKVTSGEKDWYIGFIQDALNDMQVTSWFTGDWNIINEAEIILPKGVIKRPDRVMTQENHTLVIDYKFGGKIDNAYEYQVSEYARLLQDMGYMNVEAYLWYVKLKKVLRCNI